MLETIFEINQTKSRKRELHKKQLKEHRFQSNKGDQIFIYSDGITDQFDAQNNRKIGAKKLLSLIQELPEENCLGGFKASFSAFKGSTSPLDDQTLAILTV